MLAIRTGIHETLVRIANREGPDQTASSEKRDLGLHCCQGLLSSQKVFSFQIKEMSTHHKCSDLLSFALLDIERCGKVTKT